MTCNDPHHSHRHDAPQSAAAPCSRRGFMLGAAGAGLLAAGVARPALAASKGSIDVHHHILPPAYFAQRGELFRKITPGFASASDWTPQRSIEDMDKFGGQTAVVSISVPGVWNGVGSDAEALARLCNDYTAELKRDYPKRFGHFAVMPLPDIDLSLKELEYALDTLHADGVVLYTNYTDKYLGDPAFTPFLEELNRRKVVAFVHPTTASCCVNAMPDVGPAIIEFPNDTARTVSSLLWSGALTRFPDIRFIFSHGGGPIPMIAERLAVWVKVHEDIAAKLPNGALYELKRLHVDIVMTANPVAFGAMRNLFSVNNILFGTDFPFGSTADTDGGLKTLGLDQKGIDAIRFANALGLMPQLA